MAAAGIDRLVEQLNERNADRLKAAMARAEQEFYGTTTPIEHLMLIAMARAIEGMNATPESRGRASFNIDAGLEYREPEHALDVLIQPQCKVCDLKADFVVTIVDGAGRAEQCVIECDGHDYHERSKGQALRDRRNDRSIQRAGRRMLRFTGAEIHHDPLGCADEVVEWITEVWTRGREGSVL